MFKPILAFLAGILCGASAFAQVELRSDHPDRYVVVKGDTLWDISERFLAKPWLWPEIWQVNPQIENPHLIYPGDEITLVYIDGEPRLTVRRTVKLSPHARRTPLADAIEPINLQDIRHYLDKRTILDPDEVDDLPYVLAIEEANLNGIAGQRVYVRGLEGAAVGDSYAVVRPTVVFRELPHGLPWDDPDEYIPDTEPWEYPAEPSISDGMVSFWENVVMNRYTRHIRVLGHEVLQTGIGQVVEVGDPTTLLLTSGDREVTPGDLVIPVFSADYDLEYVPHAPASVPESAQIIALSRALFGSGPSQVVAINKGRVDGIEHGHVFSTYRPGPVVRDKVKYPRSDTKTYFSPKRRRAATVKLPDEYTSHIMIFKAHERISYGLIMRGTRPVKVFDTLKLP